MGIVLAKPLNVARIDLFPMAIPAFTLKCRLVVFVRKRNPVFQFEDLRILDCKCCGCKKKGCKN